MFRHVNKFTKELRDFNSAEYDAGELADISTLKRTAKQSKKIKKGKPKPDNDFEEYQFIFQ